MRKVIMILEVLICLAFIFVSNPLSSVNSSYAFDIPIYEQNFEILPDDWFPDNGVWQIGFPTSGPGECHSGTRCAGTNLTGDYPDYTASRLIGPTFALPSDLTADEEIHLQFWHWFNYYPYNVSNSQDLGQVIISTYDVASGWSAWENIGDLVQNSSDGWSLKSVELTAYAGQWVRIAFYHVADENYSNSGWYIDDVQVVRKTPAFTGDFEMGWTDWSADNGVWQVGAPTSGPGACHDGNQCAGTVLGGGYPNYTASRLIGPTLGIPSDLTADEEIHLQFWLWFNYYPYNISNSQDLGQVQISTYDEASGWSAWQNIGSPLQNSSDGWSLKSVELTAYAGQWVRIAFYHVADESYTSTGWYIDDVQVVRKTPVFTGDFEMGWMDWSADNGVWQIGAPANGPEACHDGNQCAGTVLRGIYPNYSASRLIGPTFIVPVDLAVGQEIHLQFWHWFNYYPYNVSNSQDWGQVQISTYDEASGWSAWRNIGPLLQNNSGGWTLKDQDLTSYARAGQKVRTAFLHSADENYSRDGWFIDGLKLVVVDIVPPVATTSIMPTLFNVHYIPSAYIPDPCTTIIELSAYDPLGGGLNYIWQFPDGVILEGDLNEMEFVPPGSQPDPYQLHVAAWSDLSLISSFTKTLNIFTIVFYDFNDDDDIDGMDLKQFANTSFNDDDLKRFAMEFGLVACQ